MVVFSSKENCCPSQPILTDFRRNKQVLAFENANLVSNLSPTLGKTANWLRSKE